MTDTVYVHFSDGSTTVIYVDEDDDIQAAIADLCEEQGWNTDDVTDYQVGSIL